MAYQLLLNMNEKKKSITEFLGLTKGTNLIFVGNPGVGKSCILNGITGGANFTSGVSEDGAGITSEIKKFEKDGIFYWDSPGLADMKMRKEAAEHIQKLFNLGGNYKIFFVVTLEAGRLRPADKLTIDQILTSIKGAVTGNDGIPYGVIFNKLTPIELKNMEDSENPFRGSLTAMINTHLDEESKTAKTLYTYGFPRSADLDTTQPENNKMPMNPEFQRFVATVPPVELAKDKAEMVDANALVMNTNNEKFCKFEQVINAMKNNADFMKDVIQLQREDMKKLTDDHRRREEKLQDLNAELAAAQQAAYRGDPDAKSKEKVDEPDGWSIVGNIVGVASTVAGVLQTGLVSEGIKGLSNLWKEL